VSCLLREHFFKNALCDNLLDVADPQRRQAFRVTRTISTHKHAPTYVHVQALHSSTEQSCISVITTATV